MRAGPAPLTLMWQKANNLRLAPEIGVGSPGTRPPSTETVLTEKIEVRPQYVHVVCAGTIEIDDFVLALNHGLETAASSGRRAVVMDVLHVDGTLSAAERFVLGDSIAYTQHAHGFVAMIAVVGKEPPLEPDRFAEKVAINRGAVGKSFTDLSNAERWIEDSLAKFQGGASPGVPRTQHSGNTPNDPRLRGG